MENARLDMIADLIAEGWNDPTLKEWGHVVREKVADKVDIIRIRVLSFISR